MSLSKIAVIVRSFNNPHVTKTVKNFLGMGVGRVIVVVNAAQDKGATAGYLEEIRDQRLLMRNMWEGYSWSNALNLGVMSMQIDNARRGDEDRFEFVFNASVEAQFSSVGLESMVNAMADESVAVVGTSFLGKQDGNVVSLGRSYRHPRNTGMLIRLASLGRLWGGFDAWCDGIGGMEDVDFVFRARALAGAKIIMLDLQVPLLLGKHHHQPTKEDREQKAMDIIVARWRYLFERGTSERERLEQVIAEMKLEERR